MRFSLVKQRADKDLPPSCPSGSNRLMRRLCLSEKHLPQPLQRWDIPPAAECSPLVAQTTLWYSDEEPAGPMARRAQLQHAAAARPLARNARMMRSEFALPGRMHETMRAAYEHRQQEKGWVLWLYLKSWILWTRAQVTNVSFHEAEAQREFPAAFCKFETLQLFLWPDNEQPVCFVISPWFIKVIEVR